VDENGAAASGRGGKSILLIWWYRTKMRGKGILHTTGIHKLVVDPKKVRKKGSTFCPPKKVRSEGSPFSPPFFHCGKNR
jgi:hypothetical protein